MLMMTNYVFAQRMNTLKGMHTGRNTTYAGCGAVVAPTNTGGVLGMNLCPAQALVEATAISATSTTLTNTAVETISPVATSTAVVNTRNNYTSSVTVNSSLLSVTRGSTAGGAN